MALSLAASHVCTKPRIVPEDGQPRERRVGSGGQPSLTCKPARNVADLLGVMVLACKFWAAVRFSVGVVLLTQIVLY